MARQADRSLSVELDGKRRFISVPAGCSNVLHIYLRSKNVRSSPPEPAFTGFDNIELANDIDVGGVQQLLDAWA